MGQCSGTRKKDIKTEEQKYWCQPSDTQELGKRNLPQLHFQGSLANFKIRDCPFSFLSIRVEIKDVETFLLKQKKIKNDNTAKWSFDQKFGFHMTEYEMRKSFMKVYFEEENKSVCEELSINLYLISTGPYHQDYSIKTNNGQLMRVSFDIKISQIIQIKLDSLEADLKLALNHPGQKFNFSIKTIIGYHSPLNVSSSSYTVQVMINEKDKQVKSHDNLFYIKGNNNLKWSKEKQLQMPSVLLKILASEIHHSYLQILIWKINQKNVAQLYGECYFALNKVFDKDPEDIVLEGKLIEQRLMESCQKIWHHGRAVGTGSFKFNVQNEKYIKQMQVMVRTEEGISKFIPVYGRNEKNKKYSCKQIEEIVKIGEQIEFLVQKLDKIQSSLSYPSLESRKLKIKIQKNLQTLLQILEKSDKKPLIVYSYSSKGELNRSQQILIGLGFKIISYLEEQDVLINQLCWQILIALLKRGEFLLLHLGFDEHERENIRQNKKSQQLKMRYQIALTYFQFLRKLLEIALNSLNIEGAQYEKCFAEMFCAIAYFRIPKFRNTLLQILVEDVDLQINQWRGLEYNAQDDINYEELQKQISVFSMLCDWDRSYHCILEEEERYQIVLAEVDGLIAGQAWRQCLKKKGSTFFSFLKYFVEYVQTFIRKTKDIQWKYLPGYNKLAKCFLSELKKRSIVQYPDSLKVACYKLLSNQKLLNPISLIILNKKANMHEPKTVVKSIEFLHQIFTTLSKEGHKIQPNFNYFNLYNSIKIVLESNFFFAISKIFVLLYTHFKIFSPEFRHNISMLFLGKLFFTFFLHWSYNVRCLFHSFILMRIIHDSKSMAFDYNSNLQEMNEQVISRYEKLQRIVENAEEMKKMEKSMNFIHSYEKDLFKKMKKKMIQRKKVISRQMRPSKQEDTIVQIRSPFSQKFDTEEKYSTSLLSKTKDNERAHSEYLKPTFKLPLPVHKQPQVKRLKSDHHQIFNHQIYDTTAGKKEIRKINLFSPQNQYCQEDFKIEDTIEPHLIEYILTAVKQFRALKEELKKHIKDKSWEMPKIQIQLPLDCKQINPDQIDQW